MEKLTNVFKIEYTKGDTYALAIKFKNITEDLDLAYLSVKDNPDEAPLIQKTLGTGINKIDDRAYKNEKTYKFQLEPADSVNLEAQHQYLYDIRVVVSGIVKTVLHGVFVLRNTITGTNAVTLQNFEVEVDDEIETELLDSAPATNGIEYELDPVACAKIGDLNALITTNKETVVKAINEVDNKIYTTDTRIDKIVNGNIIVPKASTADTAMEAGHANVAETANTATLATEAISAETANTATLATEANSAVYTSVNKNKTIEERLAYLEDIVKII